MATATGPWIESTIVLCATIFFRVCAWRWSQERIREAIGITSVAAGLGGIIAIACGWAFPTLYFLDSERFLSWMQNPWYFALQLGGIVAAGALFGFVIAEFFGTHMLEEERMPFPIGELVYKMVSAQQQLKKSWELMAGAVVALIYSVIQSCTAIIPTTVMVVSKCMVGFLCIPRLFLRLDMLPIFWSIGFVTGHVIALPLAVGLFSKIVLIDPVHFYFFKQISSESFLLAFISGLMLHGVPYLLKDVSKSLVYLVKKNQQQFSFGQLVQKLPLLQLLAVFVILFVVLSSYNFSLFSQIYLLLFTLLTTHQLLVIAGKTGLAPFPRFATFVMIPGLLLFGFDPLFVTMLSTFVEVCGGVAVDLMFGRKYAVLSGIPYKKITFFQIVALIAAVFSVGFIFWYLISTFGLGTPELFAQRASARAALVRAFDFNLIVLALGVMFGFVLKYMHVNSALVVGGLAMPPDLSILLIGGGFTTYLVKDRERYYPFWSGVFAASSLWMVVKAILL